MVAAFGIKSLQYISLFSYTPRPSSPDTNILQSMKNTKTWTIWLKQDRMVTRNGDGVSLPMSRFIAESLYNYLSDSPFLKTFDRYKVLIPIPRSNPVPEDGLWVPKRIADEMVRKGLGNDVVPCLIRAKPVNKSSQSVSSQRPLPSVHYDSLSVEQTVTELNEVILIDDVITRGSTLIAAANKLIDIFPKIKIESFAAIRTISNPLEFRNWFNPVEGTITFRSGLGDTIRTP